MEGMILSGFKKIIPNLLTLGNILCGLIGLTFVYKNALFSAAYCIWAGALFDFLDGSAARWLNARTKTGKELDSLADVVSFGVLPAFILFNLMGGMLPEPKYLAFTSFFLVLFSAWRLAKFNTDERQLHDFIGIPTPASAFLFSGFPFVMASGTGLPDFLMLPAILPAVVIFISILMVSPVFFISLKIQKGKKHKNLLAVFFVFSGLLSILFFGRAGISLVIMIYIVVSFFLNIPVFKKWALDS